MAGVRLEHAVDLVRSLFCGLPRMEHRMAVFLSSSDENSGKDHRGLFLYGGLVAPVTDWWEIFTPLWQERVLDGPPKICFLHMVDIRSEAWRTKHGLSREEGERRVDEAFSVIKDVPSLCPITSRMNGGKFRDSFPNKLLIASGARKHFAPDYLAFIGYAFTALAYISENYPQAEKVDFLVERKDGVTDNVNEFFDDMQVFLKELGSPHLSELVGGLIPGGKERLPLQVADVLCWHAYRRETNALDAIDARRYEVFAHRGGERHEWPDAAITQLKQAAERQAINAATIRKGKI